MLYAETVVAVEPLTTNPPGTPETAPGVVCVTTVTPDWRTEEYVTSTPAGELTTTFEPVGVVTLLAVLASRNSCSASNVEFIVESYSAVWLASIDARILEMVVCKLAILAFTIAVKSI